MKEKAGMRGLIFALLAMILMTGCQAGRIAPTEDLAEKTYNDLGLISEAVTRYKEDHGDFPRGDFWQVRATLFQEGYLKAFPSPAPGIFSGQTMDYRLDTKFAKMDDNAEQDAAIAVWGLKDDFCRAFNNRYSSDHSGATIYDWEAAGKKYPGQTIGRHMKTYAIKWESDAVDDCEVEWVIEYR
jgi:hypothetical protein